jgi:hypothetical protein
LDNCFIYKQDAFINDDFYIYLVVQTL